MNKIKKHFYCINTDKIDNKRIVLLSDIHYFNKRDGKKLDLVLKQVIKLKPDYICIAGDLLDNAYISDKDIICNLIKNLSEISQVFIAIGNHDLLIKEDFETGFDKELFNEFNNISNVAVLDNQSVVVDNICFLGITFPASYYYKDNESNGFYIKHMNKTFTKIDDKNFNVLLCHSPLTVSKKEVFNKIKINNSLDLILSGHTHGGITPEILKPILKNRGLISPSRKIFFNNAYGKVLLNKTNMIISSGITKASHRNKFHILDNLFAREITVIDIKNRTRQ